MIDLIERLKEADKQCSELAEIYDGLYGNAADALEDYAQQVASCRCPEKDAEIERLRADRDEQVKIAAGYARQVLDTKPVIDEARAIVDAWPKAYWRKLRQALDAYDKG